MTAPDSSSAVPAAVFPAEFEAVASVEEIDQSCRWPVLLFFSHAVGWLLIGLVLALLVAIKLHVPGFLADIGWLTIGRLRPAAMNALIYGFAFQGVLPVVLWIICRLGAVPLLNHSLILFAGGLWNLGLILGLFAILGGQSSGFVWLEVPIWIAALLFVAYALIAIWALITFHYRRERGLYVSQWYFIVALFSFPWIYSAANYLLLRQPVRGVMQTVVNAWYANNLFSLYFIPLVLGIVFYFLPKLLGRPLYSRSLALLGFWTHLLFSGWTVLVSMIGSPVPVWMVSTSTAFSLLMVFPLLAVAMNWHLTLVGQYARIKNDIVLRFVFCSALTFLVGATERIVLACPAVARVTELTFVPIGWTQLMLLGCVGTAVFAGMSYILPRVTRLDWPTARLTRLHFGLTIAGVSLHFLATTVGGLLQGYKLLDPSIDIIRVMKMTVPLVGLGTLAVLLLLAGQVALALNLYGLVNRFCRACCPTCCSWLKLGLLRRVEAKP